MHSIPSVCVVYLLDRVYLLQDLHKQLYNSNLDPKEIDKAIAGQVIILCTLALL